MSPPPPLIPQKDHPPFGHLKILQVNLNHCRAANEALRDYMINHQIDVALLQDAHCGSDGTLSVIPINCAIFPSKDRSAHLVLQSKALGYSHLFTGHNCAFITIMAKEVKLIIGSTYATRRFNFEDTLAEWQHLITQTDFFIYGDDFNASSTLWGYTQNTGRGDSLVEHLAVHNLSIGNLNISINTFVTKKRYGDIITKGFSDSGETAGTTENTALAGVRCTHSFGPQIHDFQL